jgi:hypothetical protein
MGFLAACADLSNGIPLERLQAMSTFYLLPPRPFLAEFLAGWTTTLLPALPQTRAFGTGLADALGVALASQPDVFVVYREELPDGVEPLQALAEGFGAEPGDSVVEVRPGARPGEVTTRRRVMSQAA